MKRIILTNLYWRVLNRDGRVKLFYDAEAIPDCQSGDTLIAMKRDDRNDRYHNDAHIVTVAHIQKVLPLDDTDRWHTIVIRSTGKLMDL